MSLDLQGKSPRLRRTAPSSRDSATLEQDRRKTRPIPAGKAYLAALGIKSTGHFTVAGQKMPIADPAFEPIDELLA